MADWAGYAKLRPGHIHLLCPMCGRKMSNVPKCQFDSPAAELAHIPCERCSAGNFVDGPWKVLDGHGKELDEFAWWEGEERKKASASRSSCEAVAQ